MSLSGGTRHFHEELARLKNRLLEMSALAEELVRASVEALRERDEAAAREVVARDRSHGRVEIDDLHQLWDAAAHGALPR